MILCSFSKKNDLMMVQHNNFFFANKSIILRKGVCPQESIQKKNCKKN